MIFSGDSFVGRALDGLWKRGYTGGVNEDPMARIETSGALFLKTRTQSAGTGFESWLNGHAGFYIQQDAYVDVHLEVESSSPANDYYVAFSIRRELEETEPSSDNDFIEVRITRTSTPNTQIFVRKNVNGLATTLYAATTITNNEGTFRIKFRPDDDEIDVFFHDGTGDVVEGTDELTLIDDTLDLSFEVGYPAYEFTNESTTSYESYSEHVTAYQPDIPISYVTLDASDLGKGDVKVFDTMDSVTESDWRRVYSEDHDFTGDVVFENGLVRMIIDNAQAYGLELYYWNGSAWSQPLNYIRLYQETDARSMSYPFFNFIEEMKRQESVTLRARLCESGTESGTEYVEIQITMKRGKRHIEMSIIESRPTQDLRIIFNNSTELRRSYVGDSEVGDADMGITGTNTVLTDNYMVALDDEGTSVAALLSSNQKPNAASKAFFSFQGSYLSMLSLDPTDFDDTILYLGLIPFSGTIAG